MVVKCLFISCCILKVSQAYLRPPFTSEANYFEPINIQTCYAPQNDRLNLSFVKDKHTNGKKLARNGRNTIIYKGTFVSNHSLLSQISVVQINSIQDSSNLPWVQIECAYLHSTYKDVRAKIIITYPALNLKNGVVIGTDMIYF